MLEHARRRKRAYALALALRHDIVLGSPFALRSMSPEHIWLPALCGGWKAEWAAPGSSQVEEAQVARACGPRGGKRSQVAFSRFRVDQMYGLRSVPLEPSAALASFQNDFWLASSPEVVASFINVSDAYDGYVSTLSARSISQADLTRRGFTQTSVLASHYLWPVHIQHVLRGVAAVRYARVQAVMGRHAFQYLLSGGELASWVVPSAGTLASALGEVGSDRLLTAVALPWLSTGAQLGPLDAQLRQAARAPLCPSGPSRRRRERAVGRGGGGEHARQPTARWARPAS